MGRLVFYILNLLCCVVLTPALAQNEQFKFRHLSVNDGLSDNQVTTILKDSKGFVWIGTASGLNRFDGYNIRNFRHDPRDSTSLPHNSITKVFEAPDGRIGVFTTVGLTLFDPLTEKFIRYLRPFYRQYQIVEGSLNDVVKDGEGIFWFIQPDRLVQYDPAQQKSSVIKNIPGDTLSIAQDSITNFTFDKAGNHWVVHRNGVLEKLSVAGEKVRVASRSYYLSRLNSFRPFNYRIMADEDGDLWFMLHNDNQGVYHYVVGKDRFYHFNTRSAPIRLNANIIGGIAQDNNGMIWVGTDHGGVNLIDKKNRTVQYLYHRDEEEKTLSENSVTTIYRDDAGIVWIGTFKRGVSYYHKSIFRFNVYKHYSLQKNSLPFADVNRFVEDDKGNIWIGTNGGGLIYFDRVAGTFRQFKHNPSDPNSISGDVIVSLCMDSEKRLWIGTYYEGLNMFDGKKFTRYKFNAADRESLSGRSVWEIFEDSRKNLWIGTLEGGVNILDRKTGKFQRLKVGGPNAIQSTYISAITEDKQGNIWFGSSTGIDVYSLSSDKFTHYASSTSNGSLSNGNIFDIMIDSKDRIWVATSEGLNVFDSDRKTFQTFWEEDGLPSNTVLTIEEDAQGHLWLSTARGISEGVVEGAADKIKIRFRNYTEPDGLQGLQFNENASYRTKDGELIFGGPNGFNIFDGETTAENSTGTKVVFTDFQLFQRSVNIGEQIDGRTILKKSITETESIVLPPNKNFFSIEFSNLSYMHPERTSYQYKLEGLNSEWLPVDKNTHKITFTSLNPDEYTLHVRAADSDGNWTGSEAVLAITILPPFWKTNTAFFLYVFFVMIVLFVARRLIQQREQMKFAIEQERQEAIRMHELDMMKIKFFTNVSHEFRTPLTLIITPLEKMLRHVQEQDLRQQYLLIHRNAKRLLNLVNQLLDFRKMEVQDIRFNPSEGDIISFIREAVFSFSDLSEKKSIKLEFVSEIESLETIFDQDKLEKILFNLLSNAFKFTPEHGMVSVFVSLKSSNNSNELQIKVKDTGIGISKDKLEKIFERFFQNDLPPTLVNQGSGIGLSITKEFVKIHGGRIDVESEPGVGSTFTVCLPVKDVFHPERNATVPAAIPVLNNVSAETSDNVEMLSANGDRAVGEKKHSLLLIEDNDDFRFYLKDNLKINYVIFEARNGKEGWAQTVSNPPDLIVSDVMMPEMNGIELCRKIKTDNRVSHIPVILLTARTGEEQRLEGFETGADDYITKPFNFEILESRIRNLIAQREKSHKTFRKTLDIKASELNITPLDTKFIENAIKCVEANVSSPDFSVEHLGRELGISRAYLYKKIMALTGKSPLEFIRTIRLQHAAQLLEKSQLTVSEVAYKVGFNNPKYFTKYFKEEFNVLPSGYAASRKKQSG